MNNNYTATITSSKTQTVSSHILTIDKGIKLYPMRLGLVAESDKTTKSYKIASCEDDPKKFKLENIEKCRSYKYPLRFIDQNQGELYKFYPTPLRDGWLYIVSHISNAVYEYKVYNFRYNLYRLYKPNQTKSYEHVKYMNWKNYIACNENDKIFLFYSEFRIEETSLKLRFFENAKVILRYGFDAKKWRNRNVENYPADPEARRMDVHNFEVLLEDGSEEYLEQLDLIVQGLNSNINYHRAKNSQQTLDRSEQDIFFLVDDPIGAARCITDDIDDLYTQQKSLLQSINTGISPDTIYQQILSKSPTTSNEQTQEIESMQLMATLLKKLFLDKPSISYSEYVSSFVTNLFTGDTKSSNLNELKKYISDCKNELDETKINNILGISARKLICNRINKSRLTLINLLGSHFFKDYCYFFLDQKEIDQTVDQSNYPFAIPESFDCEYQYSNKDGKPMAHLHFFKCFLIKNACMDFYLRAKRSPFSNDYLLKDTNDPYQGQSFLAEQLSKDNPNPKSVVLKMIAKETMTKEYFDQDLLMDVKSFFEVNIPDQVTSDQDSANDVTDPINANTEPATDLDVSLDFWSFGYLVYKGVDIFNASADLYLFKRLISFNVTFDLMLGEKGDVLLNDIDTNNQPRRPESVVRQSIIRYNNGEQIVLRTKNPVTNQDVLHVLTSEQRVQMIHVASNKPFTEITIDKPGTLSVDFSKGTSTVALQMEICPKANWEVAKNAFEKVQGLQAAKWVNKLLASRAFAGFGAILSYVAFKRVISNPERSTLRKLNDTAMITFTFAALSKVLFSDKFLNTKMLNPLRLLNKLSLKKNIVPHMITKSAVFDSFIALGNITEGIDALFESDDLSAKGNTTVATINKTVGVSLIIFSIAFLVTGMGWAIYLIATVILLFIKYLSQWLKDSPFKLFIELTIFHKKFNYDFKYLKSQDQMPNVYQDLIRLLEKDRAIRRNKPFDGIATFRHQLDELLFKHLFVASVSDTYIKFIYPVVVHEYGHRPILCNFPTTVEFSFSINLSLLINQVDEFNLQLYSSRTHNPTAQELSKFRDFEHVKQDDIFVNGGRSEKREGFLYNSSYFNQDYLSYKAGEIYYRYAIADTGSFTKTNAKGKEEKRTYRDLSTYPFFANEKLYIFVYLRLKLKNGTWMPHDRNNQTTYFVTRLDITVDKGRSASFNEQLTVGNIDITNKPKSNFD